MKLFLTQKCVDYKVIVILVVCLATVVALVVERVLYQLCGKTADWIIAEYKELVFITSEERKEFFCYLLTNRLKQTICLIISAFTIVGLPVHVLMFFQKTYRYLFFLAAMFHNRSDLGFILCIPVAIIWFLFCVPVYVWGIKTSLYSFRTCLKDGKGICHSTKYQLQTEVKIGIIILMYVALGAVVDCVVCTYFLQSMF